MDAGGKTAVGEGVGNPVGPQLGDLAASRLPERVDGDGAARVARIEAWALLHPRADKRTPPEALQVANEIRSLAIEFSAKCLKLRSAMKS